MPALPLLIGGMSLAAGLTGSVFAWKLGEEMGSTMRYALIGGGAFLLARHFKVI